MTGFIVGLILGLIVGAFSMLMRLYYLYGDQYHVDN